ncbi:regulatory signaling modulator protein AmpE [Pseudomonas sp. UBA2684]|uniref:regulatory signaling modulator protein AmpE n=1 Tax=Pseudomonas sp. UBA2684 TaxID=1947311 RepID=UPI0025F64ABA|nr:regulatory signaling modulator protein AmpE [Pseudomonas sp. UBA2684]|tara:strand:- start:5287 stop:6123 length:837 start_codon:yes stop_codon:yes gene_type:complete
MSFLVLLLVLWVEKFSAWRSMIQQDGPWLRLLAKAERQADFIESPWLAMVLLVVLPLVALALLLTLLEPLAYGWLALPVHLLVVIYSLGRGDLQAALGPFRDSWRRGDSEAAYLVARRDLAVEADEEGALLQSVQGHLVWQAYQSFFAVIFWYALLGPLAALAYRLFALMTEHAEQAVLRERAVQLRHAFDWLPVRVLAASFALVGNFAAVSRALLHELLSWDISAAQLVINVGRAASETPAPVIGEDGVSSLDGLWQLLVRAAVLWYALFAVWTLFL